MDGSGAIGPCVTPSGKRLVLATCPVCRVRRSAFHDQYRRFGKATEVTKVLSRQDLNSIAAGRQPRSTPRSKPTRTDVIRVSLSWVRRES